MLSVVILQLVAYAQYRKEKRRAISVLSKLDRVLYAGKHVMVNRHCGSVVIAENTLDEARARAYALGRETRKRLISTYIPHSGDFFEEGKLYV
jgi:hypothetical protein